MILELHRSKSPFRLPLRPPRLKRFGKGLVRCPIRHNRKIPSQVNTVDFKPAKNDVSHFVPTFRTFSERKEDLWNWEPGTGNWGPEFSRALSHFSFRRGLVDKLLKFWSLTDIIKGTLSFSPRNETLIQSDCFLKESDS